MQKNGDLTLAGIEAQNIGKQHVFFRAVRFRTRWFCYKIKNSNPVWHLRFTKFVYSCSCVLGIFDIMFLYIFFYFLYDKAKLDAVYVALTTSIAGTKHNFHVSLIIYVFLHRKLRYACHPHCGCHYDKC